MNGTLVEPKRCCDILIPHFQQYKHFANGTKNFCIVVGESLQLVLRC
jgi:hypothetical protein